MKGLTKSETDSIVTEMTLTIFECDSERNLALGLFIHDNVERITGANGSNLGRRTQQCDKSVRGEGAIHQA